MRDVSRRSDVDLPAEGLDKRRSGPSGVRLDILGGAALERYIWWNFVSFSQQKIEAAKEEWRKGDWGLGQFDLPRRSQRIHSAVRSRASALNA